MRARVVARPYTPRSDASVAVPEPHALRRKYRARAYSGMDITWVQTTNVCLPALMRPRLVASVTPVTSPGHGRRQAARTAPPGWHRRIAEAALAALAAALASTVFAACAHPSAIATTVGSGAPSPADDRDPRAVQPERPSVATHAGTVAPGFLELEAGFERDRATDRTHASLVPVLFKFGLGNRTQLSLSTPATGSTGVPFGVGDVSLGLKWRIAEDRPIVRDFAVLPQVKFSTGGARGTRTTDVSLLLISSRAVGPVAVDVNAGGTWRTGDGALVPRTATQWTVAAALPVRGKLGWVLECYGYPGTGGPAGSAPIVALLGGPTWLLRPGLALDAGIIAPITGPQSRALYFGLVTSLGKLLPH